MTTRDLADLRRALDDIDEVLAARAGRARAAGARDRRRQGRRRRARCATPSARRRCCSIASAYGERLGLDPALRAAHLPRDPRRLGAPPARLAAERPTTEATRRCAVAYQGTEGAYGHEAALRHFGVERRPVDVQGRIGRSARRSRRCSEGDADRAVLPIENTTAGSVHEVYDLLFRLNLSHRRRRDRRDAALPARRRRRATLESLRRVHSHPQALAQCSEFLAELPGVRDRWPPANTALAAAARGRAQGDPTQAAIASAEAGERFGLIVLERDIANQAVNLHAVRGRAGDAGRLRSAHRREGVAGARHAPRARRAGALPERARRRRPEPDQARIAAAARARPWEYVFYIDVEGHLTEPRMQAALAGLAGADPVPAGPGLLSGARAPLGGAGRRAVAGIIDRLWNEHLPSSNQMPSVPGSMGKILARIEAAGFTVRAPRA